MKEIKFRAWTGNIMIYDVIVWDGNTILEIDEYHHSHKEVKSIMQYTGLKDKNGKKIYENDIIKYDFKWKIGIGEDEIDRIGEVVMDEYMWCVDEHSINRVSDVEVIGNLYENKELLD